MEAILKKELVINKQACRAAAVFLAVTFISLGAFVRIPLPFTPVPVTLQTFFVLLSAGLLNRRLGLTAQVSYLFLGGLGLPIFTGSASGLGYFISPTAGYLFGFILATIFVAGSMRKKTGNFLKVIPVFCIASMIILSCGTIWLKFILGVSVMQAFFLGFLPFIPGDLFKAISATFIYLKLKRRTEEIL